MAAGSPTPDWHTFSFNNAGGVVVGNHNHAYGRIQVSVLPAANPPGLVSLTDPNIEVPVGSPLLDHLIDAAVVGTVHFLTRQGRRVAAVVPADVAESVLAEGSSDDDLGGGCDWEPDVPPVLDPAELRGEQVPDFDEFLDAVVSDRRR